MPGPGDADYEIVTRLRAEDAVEDGAASAERRLRGVEQEGQRVGRSLTRVIGGAFAGIAGGVGLRSFIGGVISLNSEMDTARRSLASLFLAGTNLSTPEAMRLARTEMRALNEDAARGVGELENYLGAYQLLFNPVSRAGGSQDTVRDLVRNSLAAGFALRGQEGLDFAPLDIVQSLQQGVNERTTPIALAALQAAGITEKEFESKDILGRVELLNRAFGEFSGGIELMGQTWDAQTATMRDSVRGLARRVTQPLFDRWVNHLKDANRWLKRNEESLGVIADRWGQRLIQTWDILVERAGTYAALVAAASLAPLAPAAVGAAGAGGAAAVAGAGAARAGLGRLLGAAGLAAMVAGGRKAPGAAALAGGRVLGGAALSGLGGILSRVAGPLALVTGLFLSLQGGLQEYPAVMGFLVETGQQLLTQLTLLGVSFGFLNAKGSILNTMGAALGVTFGFLGRVVRVGIQLLSAGITGIGVFFRVLGEGAKALVAVLKGDFSGASIATDRGALALVEGQEQLKKIFFPEANFTPPEPPKESDGPVPGQGDTNVNIGRVEIIVKEVNDDPVRVARTMGQVLNDLARFPQQAKRLPTLGPA